jgi:dinuclear metal center YbgI/SA1388 family protein
MTIRDIADCIENFAPLSLQESYDNSGLIIGDRDAIATGVMLCLDVSLPVVEEAKKNRCNLILSHHPLIFHPLKKIGCSSWQDQIIVSLIKNNIALYAAHTNLDQVTGGINSVWAEKLGLLDVKFLEPQKGMLKKLVTFCPLHAADEVRNAIFSAGAGRIGNYDSCSFNLNGQGSFRANEQANPFVGKKNQLHYEPETRIEIIFQEFLQEGILKAMIKAHPYEEVAYDIYPLDNQYPLSGAGVIGAFSKPVHVNAFINKIKVLFSNGNLRYCGYKGKSVKKIAICSGAGGFLINSVIGQGADAFITSDLKYHEFQNAESKLLLIDAGHYETESIMKDICKGVLSKKFPNFAVLLAKADKNPVKYL